MTAIAAPEGLIDGFAALLRGEPVAWSSLHVRTDRFLEVCRDEDLIGLVHLALEDGAEQGWPGELRERLAREARALVATELLRQREVTSVLDGLAAHGILPILLKGTALAYSIYHSPIQRPRSDTDLLIPCDQVDPARQVMVELGHLATNFSDGEQLFRQFELGRQDAFGVDHAFDFHWKVSTQSAFADLLTYEELAAQTVAVPALGAHARAAGPVHALLLACVHPAMHHRNVERLIWVYDIHLLAGAMRGGELDRFADLAIHKGVAAICAHELERARSRFGTEVPARVVQRLGAATGEPTAVYLDGGRAWSDELVSNVGALTSWSDRLRLLREVAFPSPAYMLRAYAFTNTLGAALLPVLYVHRGLRGVWRVLTGRK